MFLSLKCARRHFELTQNGSKFYLIGGTTKFRLQTSSMEVFDFEDGKQLNNCCF